MPQGNKPVPCSKRRYRTELDAKIALANTVNRKRDRGKEEKHTYRCPSCRGWHLTSL